MEKFNKAKGIFQENYDLSSLNINKAHSLQFEYLYCIPTIQNSAEKILEQFK